MRLPRAGDVVVAGSGVADALRSLPSASVAGDAGVLPMWTATGGSAVRVLVAEGASDVLPRRFPAVACWVGNVEGLRDNEAVSMAARRVEGEGEDAMAAERSGTGSATMQNE